MKSKNDLLIIIQKVKEMITNAKENNVFNLEKFVENPYSGFKTGKEVVRKLPLGKQEDFNNLLNIINNDDSLSSSLKEEISTVVWVFRGIQEDKALKIAERRQQAQLGLYKVDFPYTNLSNENNEIVTDEINMINLFHSINNYDPKDNEENRYLLEELLNKISKEERELINEYYHNKKTYKAIADDRGLDESTIGKRLKAIVNKMK